MMAAVNSSSFITTLWDVLWHLPAPRSPHATHSQAHTHTQWCLFILWTTPAFFPLLIRVQRPPSSGHLHSLSICSELIFPLFLVLLTLFTPVYFLRTFFPTKYFLLSHSNQDRVMGMSEFLGCYCLENPMDSGAWQATVQRVTTHGTWMKQFRTDTLRCVHSEPHYFLVPKFSLNFIKGGV